MTNFSNPTISVIIPVHNGGNSFRQCLECIRAEVSKPHEIIVVADGDTDGSWQLAKTFSASVIRLPSCSGPAKARNIGAWAANGEILFFVDADVAIQPHTITQIETYFRDAPNLAALIGSYDDAPGAGNFLSQYKNLLHHYVHQAACEEASTFWGACGAIRRETFLTMGGFNEAYRFPSVEDIELGYRLKASGHTIRLCKSLQVKHLKRWDVKSLLRAEFFYRALPWTALILRDRQMQNDLNLRWTDRLSVLLVYSQLGLLLGALLMVKPILFWLLGLVSMLLIALNVDVYRFFIQKRGVIFTIRVLPWHWLYYSYCGLAFGVGVIQYWFSYLSKRSKLPFASQVSQHR